MERSRSGFRFKLAVRRCASVLIAQRFLDGSLTASLTHAGARRDAGA